MSVTNNYDSKQTMKNYSYLAIAWFSGQGSQADSCGVFTAGQAAQAQGEGAKWLSRLFFTVNIEYTGLWIWGERRERISCHAVSKPFFTVAW